jgi:hypothetical protein
LEQAKVKELKSLIEFEVFRLTSVPEGSIGTRWVTVRKPTGECKARLVAKDFKIGGDPNLEVYAATGATTTLRTTLALAKVNQW